MIMKTQKEKYERLMTILKESVPALGSSHEIEEAVIKRISGKKEMNITFSDILDFLFGWVYVGWVRTSFITLSFILIGVFIWQQNSMQKQIDYLTGQLIRNNRVISYDPSGVLRLKQMMYKLSEEKFGSDSVTISEKELTQILDSITDLQIKYRDIMKIIGEDPKLKRSIGKKLNREIRSKINL